MYVELSLHPWDEVNLITVNDLLDMFLNSICKYPVEKFVSMFTNLSTKRQLEFLFGIAPCCLPPQFTPLHVSPTGCASHIHTADCSNCPCFLAETRFPLTHIIYFPIFFSSVLIFPNHSVYNRKLPSTLACSLSAVSKTLATTGTVYSLLMPIIFWVSHRTHAHEGGEILSVPSCTSNTLNSAKEMVKPSLQKKKNPNK